MQIYFSLLAEYKIENLLNYLEVEWSRKIKDEFIEKLLNRFSQIALHPMSCTESKIREGLFKCVVTKQTSFFTE